jgi:hypothetical protein
VWKEKEKKNKNPNLQNLTPFPVSAHLHAAHLSFYFFSSFFFNIRRPIISPAQQPADRFTLSLSPSG